MDDQKIIFKNDALDITVTLNKFAGQANGVWVQQGGTVVLATAAREASQDFPGFFPLSVDHREPFAAVGKIPGGYFKREGKPSDRDVLSGRIIDRTMRPLFPKNYFDKVSIVSTVYSLDAQYMPLSLSVFASSLAVAASSIPFLEPTAACELAFIDNVWIPFPTHEQLQKTTARLVVAGTFEGINMVEGAFDGLTDQQVLDGMFLGHEKVKILVQWQNEIVKQAGLPKDDLVDVFNISEWQKRAEEFLTSARVRALFFIDKVERNKERKLLFAQFIEQYKVAEDVLSTTHNSIIEYAFNNVLQEKITQEMVVLKQRVDGRVFDEVRNIETEVGLLPKNHGSALFTRGKTQLLVSITLGGGDDEAKIETLMPEVNLPFTLHYNFPSLCVGEARPPRAPGRREVGHGFLAYNAIKAVLPAKNVFPYTIRAVGDTLSSDGSSSMATVCGTTMALMDAGVPIKSMVSGVAMGMIQDVRTQEFYSLTDIAAIEDEFGLMDFKVAGTVDKITALQMDIKYKGGLSRIVFSNALISAKKALLHILDIMKKVMNAPRGELSPLVPQFITLQIPREKIGAVIGSGGKVIREIIDRTKTSISIEDSGLVKIFGHPGPLMDTAVNIVNLIVGNISLGATFDGVVKKKSEFGLFVELFPNFDGLVHISSIPRDKSQEFFKRYPEGEKILVNVVDYDPASGKIRLKVKENNKSDG